MYSAKVPFSPLLSSIYRQIKFQIKVDKKCRLYYHILRTHSLQEHGILQPATGERLRQPDQTCLAHPDSPVQTQIHLKKRLNPDRGAKNI